MFACLPIIKSLFENSPEEEETIITNRIVKKEASQVKNPSESNHEYNFKEATRKTDEFLELIMKKQQIPGLSVTVSVDGVVCYKKGRGKCYSI